jgi:hypothetical protein
MKMDPAALASWQAITHETGDLAQNRAHSGFCTLRGHVLEKIAFLFQAGMKTGDKAPVLYQTPIAA